jgi:zinc transport system permease protein
MFLCFDKNYAETQQKKWYIIDYFLMILVAICVVLNIRVIGIVLLISFLTIPQMTAGLITRKFNLMIVLSCILSAIGSIIGIFISYKINAPSGATIIFSFVLIFILTKVCKLIYELFSKKYNLSKQKYA